MIAQFDCRSAGFAGCTPFAAALVMWGASA